ncbi:MAG TPA: UDP-N-acetylmuramate dehydrogenase [Jiangellales bacterium]|nr:UDP-N-acetylmuramate dehydrogenase [Jiangellales bacterium]
MPDTLPGRLADLTTLRLGGPARRVVEASSTEDLVAAVDEADAAGEPCLVVGGGSNLVVADEGFPGTVVRIATRGVTVEAADSCGGASVRVAAGEDWDALVARAVAEGWVGVEALSGIPGRTGATPIQNVGAYGQEVADTVSRVRTWDRAERAYRTFAAADCGFSYRDSRFKGTDRWVVLEVTFQLALGDLSEPVQYAELARRLGVEQGGRAPLPAVREAVLALRGGKGMVLDPDDHDTWSAGSFFTNPVLPADLVPAGAPAWPQPDGLVKTSAAWLIEQAGFRKGHPGPGGRVALSGKHTLALTNRGGASTADLLALAREVRDGVRERFGVELVNEPVLLGVVL